MSSNKNYSAIPVNEEQPVDSTSSIPKVTNKKTNIWAFPLVSKVFSLTISIMVDFSYLYTY